MGRVFLFRGSRGPFRSGPGKRRHHEAPPVTLMKEPCLPSLLRMGFGAWMRLGSSGHCPLCLPLKEPAARFGLWEPGFTFHLSSRPMLSSEGAERRGAHPLGPARYALSLCRAGHGSPGALVLPLPQGQFPRNAVPCGAGMRPLSGGGARESLCLSRGGGMGDARGGAWERWGEGRNLSTSGILGSVSGL